MYGLTKGNFWTLWELTIPLLVILIGIYCTFCSHMYNYLQVGYFRKNFKQGNWFIKTIHVLMFLLYFPTYLILLILGIY